MYLSLINFSGGFLSVFVFFESEVIWLQRNLFGPLNFKQI
jgi:hypothetical protein